MASECEDDGIVIEESLRESYFDYIDVACDVVFQQIYNTWSTKILANAGGNALEQKAISEIKDSIVHGFYKWIQLRLPDETIIGLPTSNTALLELVFSQMTLAGNSQADEDAASNATDCVI